MAAQQVNIDQDEDNDNNMLQWATLQLAEELYGINVMQVIKVLRMTEITPVPGAKKFIIGVINFRGNVITVVDTRMLFGLPKAETTPNTRIIVLELFDQVVGMLVDSVDEVIYLPQSAIERAPNVGTEESIKFIHGVSYYNDELIVLLDLSRIIEADS